MPTSKNTDIDLPSFNIEAERDLLAACLLDRKVIKASRNFFAIHDLYRTSHRMIFEAMERLDERLNGNGEDLSLILLRDELEKMGVLNEVGGPVYLAELCDVPTAVNYEYHAKLIHEKAQNRKYSELAEKLREMSKRTDVTPLMCQQIIDEYTGEIDEKPRPHWAFWREIQDGKRRLIMIDIMQYLAFLSDELTYRVFFKRGKEPCIVAETMTGFEYCQQRGQHVLSLKREVIDVLLTNGFSRVAAETLKSNKYFSLDILENLPQIDQTKVHDSIFSEADTIVKLQEPLDNENPFMTYHFDGRTFDLVGRQDVGVFVARQGVGKSKTIEVLISEMLMPGCEPLCPFHFDLQPDELIVLFVTEEKKDDHKRMLRRIAARTHPIKNGLLNDDKEFRQLLVFRCTDIREEKAFWILEKLESIKEKIGLTIIDTIIGINHDMNSEEKAEEFYADLNNMARIKNCAVFCTIHAAAGSKDSDGKAMGHLGSLFMRKATMQLQIIEADDEPDIRIVRSGFRNDKFRNASKSAGVYAPMGWEDGLLHFVDYTPPDPDTKKQAKQQDIRRNFVDVLGTGSYVKDKLKIEYMHKCGCSASTFHRDFKRAQKLGIIENTAGRIFVSKDKI